MRFSPAIVLCLKDVYSIQYNMLYGRDIKSKGNQNNDWYYKIILRYVIYDGLFYLQIVRLKLFYLRLY